MISVAEHQFNAAGRPLKSATDGQKPAVTIVVANYNRKSSIDDLVASVAQQDYLGEINLLYCDDQSSDGSVAYLKEHYPNVSVAILAQNSGSEAMPQNIGLFLSKSTYTGFVDSDDYLIRTDAITRMVAALESQPDTICAVSNVVFQLESSSEGKTESFGFTALGAPFVEHFNHKDSHVVLRHHDRLTRWTRRINQSWKLHHLLGRGYYLGFRMFRTEKFKEVGGWPVELGSHDDYGILLNLAALEYTDKFRTLMPVDCDAYAYRIHDTNVSYETGYEPINRRFMLALIKRLGLSWNDLLVMASQAKSDLGESFLDIYKLTEEEISHE